MEAKDWNHVRRPYLREWSAQYAGHWDAAVAGSSALREAMGRGLRIEVSMLQGFAVGLGLLDISKFHA